MAPAFKPALIIIDFQEDFCPPNGSLPIPDARAILPSLNTLLSQPFPMKLATRDWHPPTHTSFRTNHPASSTTTTITHPTDPDRSYTTPLWPVHCVADSPGAQIVSGLDTASLHLVLDKGQREDVEMFSGFYDPFKLEESGLGVLLRVNGITDIFIVGLAADYCVRATAEDAVREGYRTYVIEEGTRPVDTEKWPEVREEMMKKGIKMVSIDGEEVAKVVNK